MIKHYPWISTYICINRNPQLTNLLGKQHFNSNYEYIGGKNINRYIQQGMKSNCRSNCVVHRTKVAPLRPVSCRALLMSPNEVS